MIEESNSHDINFFNDKSEVEDSPYFSINEFNSSSQRLTTNSLHICIRSLNKNFEKLRQYTSLLKRDFSVVALTGTCCNDDKAAQNLLLQLPNYTPTYQIKNNEQRGGGVFFF